MEFNLKRLNNKFFVRVYTPPSAPHVISIDRKEILVLHRNDEEEKRTEGAISPLIMIWKDTFFE